MMLHRLVTMVLILTFVSVSFAQTPSAKDDATKNAETGQKAKDVPPALTLEDHPGDFWSRKYLTGDWGSERAKLAEHGITLDLRLSQFYQGVASGGKNTNFAYGGKLDYILKLDGKKLGLWEGLFVTMHAETQFGHSINGDAGALALPNTSMLYPLPEKHETAITGLLVEQALSKTFVLVGKFDDEMRNG